MRGMLLCLFKKNIVYTPKLILITLNFNNDQTEIQILFVS